jgi:hypothetical protein
MCGSRVNHQTREQGNQAMQTRIKANLLILDKSNLLAYQTENAFAVMGRFQTKQLEDALLDLGGDMMQVQFTTYSPDTIEQDKKTYSRRLNKLSPLFSFGGFENKVIRGHVMATTLVGTLNIVRPSNA